MLIDADAPVKPSHKVITTPDLHVTFSSFDHLFCGLCIDLHRLVGCLIQIHPSLCSVFC